METANGDQGGATARRRGAARSGLRAGSAVRLYRKGNFSIRWRLRHLLMAGVLVISATFGSLAITKPASAAVYYGVSMNSACQQQYHTQAAISAFWNPYSPYSWFCWEVEPNVSVTVGSGGWSVTVNGKVLGGIDVGTWCRSNHPGTFPVVTNQNSAFSWLCWSY